MPEVERSCRDLRWGPEVEGEQ